MRCSGRLPILLIIVNLFKYIVLLSWLVLLLQLVELECFSVLFADVFARGEAVQVENEMEHFFVARFMVEGDDWYAVVYLIGEGIDWVVYDDHVLHVSVCYDPQVLHVIPFGSLDAVLPVHAILEELVFWVDIVEDSISIGLMWSCKYHYLKGFVRLL